MALVLIIVVALIIVKVTSSSTSSSGDNPQPVPPQVLTEVTTIPTSVYNAVGVSGLSNSAGAITPPSPVTGSLAGHPLVWDGKPGVLFFGAEYCPYCAAERWALITSLSRFGKFSGLQLMKSSSSDVYASTNTFTFRSATLTSPYLTYKTIEHQTANNPTGAGYTILQNPDAQQAKIINTLDTSGSYPFVDFGNKYVVTSASYNPGILQGMTWQDIASGLDDPTNPTTQVILTVSNFFSASICQITSGAPASVCQSKGVTAAAKEMGIK